MKKMSTDYKLKLKALLHDPIDKQYVMWCLKRKHKEVAEEYFEKLFKEVLKDDNVEKADWIASAISRIIISPTDENLREKFEEESKVECEDITYIDIFSLKETKDGWKPKEQNEVEKFFTNVGEKVRNLVGQDDKARILFLFLWRFLPDIFPWVNYHPADSRAPNHSIYDHLVQTSAIVSCLPRPAFLLFTIGPVQRFIATARKTSDLWAGSYMLSYLTYKAIETILEELGPDNVIYPNLLRQPLVDRWLYKKVFKNSPIYNTFKDEDWFKGFIDNSFSDEKLISDEKLTVANFPNRFLAIVPSDRAEEIAKKCEERIKEGLKELSEKIINSDGGLNNAEICRVVKKIEEHMKSYFQIYWVYLPWIGHYNNAVKTALREYKSIIGEDELFRTVEIIINHQYYSPANIGVAYSVLLELTERLLGARKSLRDHIQNNYYSSEDEKCDLCGEFEQLKLDWDKISRGIVREGERLCGVCLTKRLFPKILKEILELKEEVRFPSTSEIASIGEKVGLDQKVKEDFKKKFDDFVKKISEGSGSSLPASISVPKLKNDLLYNIDGQWLMEESYRPEYFEKEYGLKVGPDGYKDVLDFIRNNNISPSKYYAVLMMDGDDIGKWLKGEFNPKIGDVIHEKMKKALQNFSAGDESISELLRSKHPNSASIHQAFSRRLSEFALEKVRDIIEEEHYGKLVYAGGDDVLALLPVDRVLDCSYSIWKAFRETLSEKASMSAGIVVAHHKYPLHLVLNEVRDAQKKAKNEFGKNAFCIKVIRHSGEVRITGGNWDIIEFAKELIDRFKNGKISSRFPYEFLEVIEKINDENVLKAELKRIYLRKAKKEEEQYIDKIIGALEKYEYSKEYFANLIMISRFFAGERRISGC